MTRHRQPASGVTFARNPVGRPSSKPKAAIQGSVSKVYVAYFDPFRFSLSIDSIA